MTPLSGWKEIASHLNQSVRTVQRWEDFGLPVHRIKANHAGHVVAFVEEIEAWERSAPLRYQNRINALTADVKSLKKEVSLLKDRLNHGNHPVRKFRSKAASKDMAA